MGVLNVTPDSFSDGGAFFDVDRATARGLAMLAAGADLVDVGGESTRPGADPVPAEVEIARVVPVIERLAAHGAIVSIDTTKAEVARRALAAGARVVNDISGLTFDPEIAEVVRAAEVPVILMHTRAAPKEMQKGELVYAGGVVEAVRRALAERVASALASGIPAAAIMLDPGIGFGKTPDQSAALIRGLPALCALGHPVLVGPSRKSFLGAITGKPAAERLHATSAAVALAIAFGAKMVRVHDVEAMVDVVRVAERVARGPDA
jgi:dihydropteroate synthase